jgi:hypothetical protein
VLVSKDLATVHTARTRADYPVGWILSSYDGHTQIKVEAFKPEYVFCDLELLPPGKPLWKGPWRWAISHVADLNTALQLATRGADFVVTRNVRKLGEAMRAHAATRAAHIASMTTANAVSQGQGISRAEVIAHVTQVNEEAVVRPEISTRASPPVRTDVTPRASAEVYTFEFDMEIAVPA